MTGRQRFTLLGNCTVIGEGHHLKAIWQPVPWWMSKPHKGGGQREVKVKVLVTQSQSCPTLCNPMDCRLPGSSVHGILQASTLNWVAISFSRGSSQPRNPIHMLYISFTGNSVWFSSVTQFCPTLCDPMNRSTPGLPVHHQLQESTQTYTQ